jgi:diguanylate cyclase (GGDEF)-like protein
MLEPKNEWVLEDPGENAEAEPPQSETSPAPDSETTAPISERFPRLVQLLTNLQEEKVEEGQTRIPSVDAANRNLLRMQYLEEKAKKTARELGQSSQAAARATRELREIQIKLHIDPLTGVFNRNKLDEISKGIRREKEAKKEIKNSFAVIVFDLDKFKDINDKYGHGFGDKYLIAFANFLKNLFSRSMDIVVRYGGDEFLVYLENTKRDENFVNEEKQYLENQINKYNLPFISAETEKGAKVQMDIGFSFGIAGCENDNETLESVTEKADINLYKMKNKMHVERLAPEIRELIYIINQFTNNLITQNQEIQLFKSQADELENMINASEPKDEKIIIEKRDRLRDKYIEIQAKYGKSQTVRNGVSSKLIQGFLGAS